MIQNNFDGRCTNKAFKFDIDLEAMKDSREKSEVELKENSICEAEIVRICTAWLINLGIYLFFCNRYLLRT